MTGGYGLSAINARSACAELRDKVQADYMSVHPDQLVIPELRLREVNPKTIRELADSISEVGLLQPIGVKHAGANTNRYIVIYGARRALACQLLHREAMAKATDPNKDQDVFRYAEVHVMRYRHEIPDEVCQELEIRENLDRKELNFKQKKAHLLELGAIMQRRLKKRKKEQHQEGNVKLPHRGASSKNKQQLITKPVARAVAETIGVNPNTLANRIASASRDVGQTLDLDHTPPEELEKAARLIRDQPIVPRKGHKGNKVKVEDDPGGMNAEEGRKIKELLRAPEEAGAATFPCPLDVEQALLVIAAHFPDADIERLVDGLKAHLESKASFNLAFDEKPCGVWAWRRNGT